MMGLEVFTGKIVDLVGSNPPGTDPKAQGADHIRGIKQTLLSSFPFGNGVLGLGPALLQLGQSATQTNNFTLTSEASNGTMKLARGNAGVTTQDILTVDQAGQVDFPQMSRSYLANGYMKLQGGLLLQWGIDSQTAGNRNVIFPVAFPSYCAYVGATMESPNLPVTAAMVASVSGLSPTFFVAYCRDVGASGPGESANPLHWFALGF